MRINEEEIKAKIEAKFTTMDGKFRSVAMKVNEEQIKAQIDAKFSTMDGKYRPVAMKIEDGQTQYGQAQIRAKSDVKQEFKALPDLQNCDVCEKYFVSEESLNAHKVNCIKRELDIGFLQKTLPGLSIVPKIRM